MSVSPSSDKQKKDVLKDNMVDVFIYAVLIPPLIPDVFIPSVVKCFMCTINSPDCFRCTVYFAFIPTLAFVPQPNVIAIFVSLISTLSVSVWKHILTSYYSCN